MYRMRYISHTVTVLELVRDGWLPWGCWGFHVCIAPRSFVNGGTHTCSVIQNVPAGNVSTRYEPSMWHAMVLPK